MTINWNALRAARRIISETPDHLVSLRYLRKEHPNGCVSGCGVGLCVGRPEFAESGVRAVYDDNYAKVSGMPYFVKEGEPSDPKGHGHGYTYAAVRMFGLSLVDAQDLFSSAIPERGLDGRYLTDKEVLLRRLDVFFAQHGEGL